MVARLLTVHNAEISTAAISIRTLQVAGRQVTMGVFRQLIAEDIVEPARPSLRGIGWGHVNYQVSRACDIHLVWQRGDELRRCIVQGPHKPWPFRPPYRQAYAFRSAEQRAAQEAEDDRLRAEHEAHMAWLARHDALVAPLFALPQLFIAV